MATQQPPQRSSGQMRDPNTGEVLRDRFHQMRGQRGGNDSDYANMPRAQQERRAAQFLQSRGAPMTAQNLSIAHEYLAGGNLQRLEADQPTADAISQQIDTADAGGGGGAGRGGAPDTSTRPQSRPDAGQTGMAVAEGGGVDPAWLAGGAAAGILGSAAHRRMTEGRAGAAGTPAEAPGGAAGTAMATRQPGLTGEIVDDVHVPALRGAEVGGSIQDGPVGINYPPTALPGGGGAAALPAPEDADLSGEMQGEFSTGRTTDTVQLTGGDNPTTLTRNPDGSYTTNAPNQPNETWTVTPDDPLYADMDRIFKQGVGSNRGQVPLPQSNVDIGALRRAIP